MTAHVLLPVFDHPLFARRLFVLVATLDYRGNTSGTIAFGALEGALEWCREQRIIVTRIQ